MAPPGVAPVLSRGGLYMTTGHFGTWEPAGDVDEAARIPGAVTKAALTTTGSRDVQYLVATNDGRLHHTIRSANGTWVQAGDADAAAQIPESVIDVAATSTAPGQAQFLAVTTDGSLWHTIRKSDGSWAKAASPAAQARISGPVLAVAMTDVGAGRAEVVVITREGRTLSTFRQADGSWTTAVDVTNAAGLPAARDAALISTTTEESQLAVVATNGKLLHTVRHYDGRWDQAGNAGAAASIAGNVTSVSAAMTDPGAAQFLVSTNDGMLRRTTRHVDGSWDHASAVNAVAHLPATVTATAAVGTGPGELQAVVVA